VDDFDMIWCLLERGASACVVEQPLYNYRDHAGERLTTRRLEDMHATFRRILDKHGVQGSRREALIREHAMWWGKPIWSVYRSLQPKEIPAAIRPLQSFYRALLPLSVRQEVQQRLLWWWR
jgi:hypothetical protein